MVFTRRSDAFQALKKYNNVQLDGKPMKIEIAGASSDIPVLARGNVVGVVNGKRTVVMKYVFRINLLLCICLLVQVGFCFKLSRLSRLIVCSWLLLLSVLLCISEQ